MKGLFRKHRNTMKLQDAEKTTVYILKDVAWEYIKMAVAENERFHTQEHLEIYPMDPIWFLDSLKTSCYTRNYWLAYCKTSDHFDEEVANLFMVLHVLFRRIDDWVSAINDHSPTPEDFCNRCMLTISVQSELLMKAVEALNGSYFLDKLENKKGFCVAEERIL